MSSAVLFLTNSPHNRQRWTHVCVGAVIRGETGEMILKVGGCFVARVYRVPEVSNSSSQNCFEMNHDFFFKITFSIFHALCILHIPPLTKAALLHRIFLCPVSLAFDPCSMYAPPTGQTSTNETIPSRLQRLPAHKKTTQNVRMRGSIRKTLFLPLHSASEHPRYPSI